MDSNEFSRREFLKRVLALSAAAALPTILTKNTLSAARPKPRIVGPNERVNLAVCGIGNRGGEILREFAKTGEANIVALCDVDMGAPHTEQSLKQFPNVPRFQDFRQMFDKMGDQIDAVSVGVPDFSHFPICMLAMSLGKHVYTEKPMARTFYEVELMMKAAKKYKVVNQMGNQGHSEGNYFQFKAWKDAGIIKDVTAITAHMNAPRRWHGWDTNIKSFPPGQPVPQTLDWNTWLMTARFHDDNKDYVNGQWRCWYDFGMGALGDWGAHILDTAHQFLELGLPYEIDPVRIDGHNDFFFPQASTRVFKFGARGNMPPVDVTWYEGQKNIPPVPEGYGVSELDPNIPAPSSCGRSATGGSESGRSRSRRLSRSLRTLSCRGVRTPYMTTTRRGNSGYPFTAVVSAPCVFAVSSLGAFFTDVQAAEKPRRAASASFRFLFITP